MQFRALTTAKINEFLAVGLPDETGYHPIETIFQEISYGDILEFDLGVVENRVTFEWVPSLTAFDGTIGPLNTVSRALLLLAAKVPVPPVAVHVTKRVPPESGLGAGSADAAETLRVFHTRFPETVTAEVLLDIAPAIGADVTFFLRGGRAFGTGRGDILRPLPDLPARSVVILRPKVGGSTKLMYQALDQQSRPLVAFNGELGHNDFERVADCDSLELIDLLKTLGAVSAGLSGSGSAVYGFFSSRKAAEWASAKVSSADAVFNVVTETCAAR